MALRPTSETRDRPAAGSDAPTLPARLRFLDSRGIPLIAPREWESAWVEALIPVDGWAAAELARNGAELPLSLRHIGGSPRVLAEWPRSGPGNYHLRLVAGPDVEERTVSVAPAKISPGAFARMLEDLEFRLPASVALGIQRAGGLAGMRLPPPDRTTLEAELFRLRRAVQGGGGRPGLRDLLPEIARDPHRVLATAEHWVRRDFARRPHPARLALAFASRANLGEDRQPLRVLDTRVEHTADVYENRVVHTFRRQVELRLRRLRLVLAARNQPELEVEVASLLEELRRAHRRASFLDEVSELSRAPDRVTMVLLRRPEYRSALEAYLDFKRSVSVRLDEEALDAPLENLPLLYQLWGTLVIIGVLLDIAERLGFRVVRQRLIGRDAGGVFVKVLRDNEAAVVLEHPITNVTAQLIPERTYGMTGRLHSISFAQRPDVALEVYRPGEAAQVYLFDPKYKLDGDLVTDPDSAGSTGPKKIDIDKMHAYRDAIRGPAGIRVVRYAAILYPGPARSFGDGIEALSADPEAVEELERWLGEVLEGAVSGEMPEGAYHP